MKKLFTLLCSLGFLVVLAQEGELDFSFNGSGKILYENSNFAEARSVIVQSDGMIVVGGYIYYNQGDLLVARFDRNGNPDVTFGNQGFAYIDLNAEWQKVNALHILPDGKIMLLADTEHKGERGCALVRLTSNGFLDQTFADSGWVFNGIGNGTTYWNALVQTGDGTLVAGGFIYYSNTVQMALLGFHPNGDLNLAFGDTGVVVENVGGSSTELHTLKLTPQGKLLAGGSCYFQGKQSFMMMQFEADGQVDMSFAGGNGMAISFNDHAQLYDLCFQRDGKILGAGKVERNNDDKFAMIRIASTGVLDPSFGTNGKVETSIGRDSYARFVGILGDDRIILGGTGDGIWSEDYALARYNSNGVLDQSFSYDGISTKNIGTADDEVFAGALQSDGKLILVGTTERPGSSFSRYSMSLARFIGGSGSIALGEFSEYDFGMYPNPGSDIVNLKAANGIARVRLYNLNGQVMKDHTVRGDNFSLDVGLLSPGIYQVVVSFEDGRTESDKLVIAR